MLVVCACMCACTCARVSLPVRKDGKRREATRPLILCKAVGDFANFKVDDPSLSQCLSVCVPVCLAGDSSGAVEVIVVGLGAVAASDVIMHHVLILFDLDLH